MGEKEKEIPERHCQPFVRPHSYFHFGVDTCVPSFFFTIDIFFGKFEKIKKYAEINNFKLTFFKRVYFAKFSEIYLTLDKMIIYKKMVELFR